MTICRAFAGLAAVVTVSGHARVNADPVVDPDNRLVADELEGREQGRLMRGSSDLKSSTPPAR